jgi:hypothetical protein
MPSKDWKPNDPWKWNGDGIYNSHGTVKRCATITSKDIVEHGKMNVSDYCDYIIDLETLSAVEFMKKYC